MALNPTLALPLSLSFFLQGIGVGCPDPQAIGPPHHPLFYGVAGIGVSLTAETEDKACGWPHAVSPQPRTLGPQTRLISAPLWLRCGGLQYRVEPQCIPTVSWRVLKWGLFPFSFSLSLSLSLSLLSVSSLLTGTRSAALPLPRP